MTKPEFLYHVTTPRKAKRYRESGCIKSPVRGFDTVSAALAWGMKTGRTVLLKIPTENHEREDVHKLPDHHNKYGEAWWIEGDVVTWEREFSCEGES